MAKTKKNCITLKKSFLVGFSLVGFATATLLLSPALVSAEDARAIYQSADDKDVEFSMEDKSTGPKTFYLDQEAIAKAQAKKNEKEKKEALFLAKGINRVLKKIIEQRIAYQQRREAERLALGQNSMHLVSEQAKQYINAHREQARKIIARAEYEAMRARLLAMEQRKMKEIEASRGIASLPVKPSTSTAQGVQNLGGETSNAIIHANILKRSPKKAQAKKLWQRFGQRLTSKLHRQARIASATGEQNKALLVRGRGNRVVARMSGQQTAAQTITRQLARVPSTVPVLFRSDVREAQKAVSTVAGKSGKSFVSNGRKPASVAPRSFLKTMELGWKKTWLKFKNLF